MRLNKKLFIVLIIVLVVGAVYANMKIIRYESSTINYVSQLPVVNACLVLGTSKYLSTGQQNLYYTFRMAAAKDAYMAGKCRKLVVSGDNRKHGYNEPDEMKASLISLGVPANNIFCDYAGGRTLDSVIRFRYVFGQTSGIVISQQFHNARAMYIGQANGIKLIGYNAKDVDKYSGLRTNLREIFSRIRAVADVEILHSEPRHYGEPVPL